MVCLCCGKEFGENASSQEIESHWHKRCVKKFFGMKRLPKLDINKEELERLAESTVNKGLTVPGVQKKLSLRLTEDNEKNRLTIVDYPTGYILKPQSEEFAHLPEFEYVAMRLAGIAHIKTVPHALLDTADGLAYITKRIDRDISKDKIQLLAMEDFCQLGQRLTQDKYRGSYEQCARIIEKYSEMPMLDLSELFIRVVFSFIIGNSDMHLKNFSLIEDAPGSRRYHMSAIYDILPVNIVMPEDWEEMALPVNGMKQNISRDDFIMFARQCRINEKTANKIIARLCSLESNFAYCINQSVLDKLSKMSWNNLIRARISRIK